MGEKRKVSSSECPVRAYRYVGDTKILTMWWKKGSKTTVYIYLGVPKAVYYRMNELNMPKVLKETVGKVTGETPSLGTYINTKVKKYPALDLSKVKDGDSLIVAEARKVSKDVKTRSTKRTKKKSPAKDFVNQSLFPGNRS